MGNTDHHNHISSFNPACCLRPPPIRETPRRFSDDSVSSFSSTSNLRRTYRRHGSEPNEPSSPKVGCMGQVKREKASWSGSSSSSSGSPPTGRNRNKFFKLRKMFSGRNMMSPRACSKVEDDYSVSMVSVVDMDPPLPVVKHVGKDENSVSLWKRRCGGGGLDGLQMQRQKLQLCLNGTAVV